ncbi:MAG: hypothetical protein IT366_23155 [Candidatus Hydrogenedentes bacterium]|nr:hypothetical protein [Candidatus Hydrogenedentota bacterium]
MKNSLDTGWRLAALVLSSVALLVPGASAMIIPSFYLDFSIEKATHIVLASEGEKIDGKLSVVESWKGDLRPGDAIDVPELAQFAPKETRTLKEFGTEREYGVVTGDRMILFLVKSLDWAAPGSNELKTKWLPASSPDFIPADTGQKGSLDNIARMRISVSWIEGDKTYAYEQIMNPGPLLLVNWSLENSHAVHERVNNWLSTQDALHEINAVRDPDERVKKAIAFTREHPDCIADTVEIIAGAGDAAVPALKRLLDDPTFENVQDLLIRDIGDLQGAGAGPMMTDLLKKELTFWQREAPNLEMGWWSHDPSDRRALLQNRYGVAMAALRVLEDLGYPACRDSVVEFRNFWRSQPQLEDIAQMSETCDRVLESFEHQPKAKIKHAWGFELAASTPDPAQRAAGLVRFLDVGDFRWCQRAFNAMSECGPPALPYLRTMLNDEERIGFWALVIRNMVKAGGTQIGGEIAQFISRETELLKKDDLVGTVKEWNDLTRVARWHYASLETAVSSLDEIKYAGAVKEVGDLLALLNDPNAPALAKRLSLTRACEYYVKTYR